MARNLLFQEIAESIRQEILFGPYKAGDELPTVRMMAKRLKCAPGTIQRAYQELTRQGLVIARPGQGTHVAHPSGLEIQSPFRKVSLINQMETFTLGAIRSGYSVQDIEQAFHLTLDRWKTIAAEQPQHLREKLRFVGSHDPAIALLNQSLASLHETSTMQVEFAGSIAGLIALNRQEADIAGCHLWDAQTEIYNDPFVRRIFPGKRMGLLTLAFRRLGIITHKGNPHQIFELRDLIREDLSFINRQPGAGTRVWLDAQLRQLGITPDQIKGYEDQALTHYEAASRVSSGTANLTLGIESAALAYDLGFVFLTTECYDLVFTQELFQTRSVQNIIHLLTKEEFKTRIAALGGYDISHTGQLRWIEG